MIKQIIDDVLFSTLGGGVITVVALVLWWMHQENMAKIAKGIQDTDEEE